MSTFRKYQEYKQENNVDTAALLIVILLLALLVFTLYKTALLF